MRLSGEQVGLVALAGDARPRPHRRGDEHQPRPCPRHRRRRRPAGCRPVARARRRDLPRLPRILVPAHARPSASSSSTPPPHGLAGAADLRSGFAGMLARALEAFRAEHAELLVIAPAGGAPGWRVAVGADQRVDLGGELDDAVAADLQELLGRDGRVRTVAAADAGPALAAHLRAERRRAGADRAADRRRAARRAARRQPARGPWRVRRRRPAPVRDARRKRRRHAGQRPPRAPRRRAQREPRSTSSTRPSTTRSPAWRTASCSTTASRTPSHAAGATRP